MKSKELLYIRAKDAYYNSGSPILSDYEFDILEKELKKEGSDVVNIVGYSPNAYGVKHSHMTPMKSLKKINEDEVENTLLMVRLFVNQCDEQGVEVSVKADGNACSVIYSNGTLSRALTRGDGLFGLDITDKIRHIVPSKIDFNGLIEIRGEVVITKSVFEEKYSSEYANPRNFVSGKLGKEFKFETPKHELSSLELMKTISDFTFVAYDVIMYSNHPLKNESWHCILREIKFLSHPNVSLVEFLNYTKEELNCINFPSTIYNHFNDRKKFVPYLCDGFVIKMNSHTQRQRMGETDHHPKWAVAVKFPAEQVVTTITSIEWNVGSTGKLTPKAILEPILLDGSIISKATLYNYSKVFENRTFPQAKVLLVKSGDIIPRIIEVVEDSPMANFYLQNKMEIFSSISDTIDVENDIRIEEKEAFYEGDSRYAEIKKLSNAVKILGIENIGMATCEELYNSGIRNIVDLLDTETFNKDRLIKSGIFVNGRKLEIIIESVSQKRTIEIWQIIDALQYNQVGTSMSKELAKFFVNVPYDFSGLNKSVIENVTRPNSSLQLEMIFLSTVATSKLGWSVKIPTAISKEDGITFEMTGKPPRIGDLVHKDDYVRFAKPFGYVHTSLTKDTHFLVSDNIEGNSGKMKKAKKYGTEIISYEEFYKNLELIKRQRFEEN
jgi:DNA ligase (NAD+)